MGSPILITGGAGFVGSNLAVLLKEEDPSREILALDNLKRRGSELNLPRLRRAGVRFVHGDIRNREDLGIAGFTPKTIIECSAEPSVLAGYTSSPEYVINTNLVGTINCLEAARQWSSDVIFLSTSRVYPIGKLNQLSFFEADTRFELTDEQPFTGASSKGVALDFPMDGCRSLYGATKLSSEHMLEEYSAIYGIRYVVNRCGVIAGPWQMGKVDQGVFVHWMGSHYFKKELRYFGYGGAGKQVRDLLHIEDLYRLVSLEINEMEKVNGRVFNVGGGRACSLSLKEATRLCEDITGNHIVIKGEERQRDADVRIYISDITGVRSATGWAPLRRADEILFDIFGWIRSNEAEVRSALF